MAFSKADVRRAFAAWDEGIAFVREHRVQFFEGFLARDAARLHTSDGEPEAALLLFGDATAAFQRAGNVPQLIITLASVPALFERLDRLAPAAMLLGALSREPSSFQHVPELGDVSDRVSGKLGKKRTAELTAAGAALDLSDAAVYARQQIDAARREPSQRARTTRPGGLSRREIEESTAPRGRLQNRRRDRHPAVHLVEDGRAPHPEHLYEDRRLRPRRGDSLGRQAQGRRRHRRRLTLRSARAMPVSGRHDSPARKWVGLPMPHPRPFVRMILRRPNRLAT